MMKSYLEVKVPIKFNDDWFCKLRDILKDIPVHWQRDYYHITLAFIDDTQHLSEIKAIMHKCLDYADPITIKFDKLDVFSTPSGMIIVHLTASCIPEAVKTLVGDIRNEITMTSSRMLQKFRLHVTLGRVIQSEAEVADIGFLIDEIDLEPFTLTLNEVEYREFRGRSFYKNTLKQKYS